MTEQLTRRFVIDRARVEDRPQRPPIKAMFMLACYVAADPEEYLGKDHWNSIAGVDTRGWLKRNDLVDEDFSATERGKAWVRFLVDTPLPEADWKLPERT